jgi:hypothetical protein
MRLDQAGDRVGAEQRRVAREDDHGRAAGDHLGGGAQGAAGAVGLRLDDGLGPVGKAGGEVVPGRDDHAHAPRPRLARGEDRPRDHRPAAYRVEDLGQGRAHPCALARGHDQGRRRVAHPGSVVPRTIPG